MSDDSRVVVTGIAGCIGAVVRRFLAGRWQLAGVDLHPVADVPTTLADITLQEALAPPFQGAYAVIHLAANSNANATWLDVHGPNILATQAVFEAARIAGVRRIVFASSNHVTGLYEKDQPYKAIVEGRHDSLDPARIPKITHAMPLRPDGAYAVSKAFGEALGRYYAEAFGMQVICLRIGTVNREDRPLMVRHYATLLTHSDLAALLEACLRTEGVSFDIFYGVSANTWRFWDIAHAREVLGWVPQDNAESFRRLGESTAVAGA